MSHSGPALIPRLRSSSPCAGGRPEENKIILTCSFNGLSSGGQRVDGRPITITLTREGEALAAQLFHLTKLEHSVRAAVIVSRISGLPNRSSSHRCARSGNAEVPDPERRTFG